MAEQQSNVQSFQELSERFGVLIWRWVLLVCDQALHLGDIVKSKGTSRTRDKTRSKVKKRPSSRGTLHSPKWRACSKAWVLFGKSTFQTDL